MHHEAKIHKGKLVFRLFLSFVMFGAAVLGIEIYLRHSLHGFHTESLPQDMIDQHMTSVFQYDRDLMWYWKFIPDAGSGINAAGFRRKKTTTIEKPKGVIRVIVLGDSQTYGGGVKVDETYSHYAEEALGSEWEILNAGISGYRSLNIFRLLRKKMLGFNPDIIVIDTMVFDSPSETGSLHEEAELSGMVWLRELLWNSRINYLVQLTLRKAGFGIWEDLPWPIQLHQVRDENIKEGDGQGNQEQIARWAKERGIRAIFMEYPSRTYKGELDCLSPAELLPKPSFRTCSYLEEVGIVPTELFLDTNHFSPLGAKVVGEGLARYLYDFWNKEQR